MDDDLIKKTIELAALDPAKMSKDMLESIKRVVMFAGKIKDFVGEGPETTDALSFFSLREGAAKGSFPRDEMLKNAHCTKNGFFTTNKIVEQ